MGNRKVSAAAPVASKSELAYSSILGRISDGTYGAGYRLVLGRIAADLSISVVPVREAIRRLEAEKLVTFERNVGATVAGIDPTEYLHTMQTLSIVEGAATALSAPLLSAAELNGAELINEQMRRCLEDFDPVRFTLLNRQFHTILYSRCPNPHILDLVHRGWGRLHALRSSTFAYVPGRAKESVTEHTHLLMLLRQDADCHTVEHAAREHRAATLTAYLNHTLATSPSEKGNP